MSRASTFHVLYIHISMFNPYLDQICAQTGMTRTEARREARRSASPITDAEAQARGYRSAEAYLADLHEFLNSN